jgi:hypothetical protein
MRRYMTFTEYPRYAAAAQALNCQKMVEPRAKTPAQTRFSKNGVVQG